MSSKFNLFQLSHNLFTPSYINFRLVVFQLLYGQTTRTLLDNSCWT